MPLGVTAKPDKRQPYQISERLRGNLSFTPEELAEIDRISRNAGEDEVQTAEKELDGVTKKYVEQVDALVERKEGELMEV